MRESTEYGRTIRGLRWWGHPLHEEWRWSSRWSLLRLRGQVRWSSLCAMQIRRRGWGAQWCWMRASSSSVVRLRGYIRKEGGHRQEIVIFLTKDWEKKAVYLDNFICDMIGENDFLSDLETLVQSMEKRFHWRFIITLMQYCSNHPGLRLSFR